jgi:hypothetical protein
LKREIPEGWKVDNILKRGGLMGGGTPKTIIDSYWNGRVPFYTPSDSTKSFFVMDTEKHISDLGLESCSSKLFQKGTVFITARGTVGDLNIASRNMAMNQSCYAIAPKSEINYYFLYQCCFDLIQYLKAKANGSIFDAIVSNDIKLTPICIPPLDLIQSYGWRMESVYEKVLINMKENQQLSSLRDWLLPMLMNGQVRVGETTNIEVKKVERNIYQINMQKLLHVASELHLRGYEKLRVVPSVSPSGMSWRCLFVAEPENGIITSTWLSQYSHNEREIEYSIIELTELFEREHMRFLESCKGKNKDYVEWYQNMLSHLEEDELPYAFDDYFSPTDYWKTTNNQKIKTLPNEKDFYYGY